MRATPTASTPTPALGRADGRLPGHPHPDRRDSDGRAACRRPTGQAHPGTGHVAACARSASRWQRSSSSSVLEPRLLDPDAPVRGHQDQIDNVLIDRTALQQELQSQLGTVAHGASEQVVTTLGRPQSPGPAGQYRRSRSGAVTTMLGRTDRRLRILVLLVAFAVFATAAVARLGYWQVTVGTQLRDQATARPCDQPSSRRSAATSTTATARCWQRPRTVTRSRSGPTSFPRGSGNARRPADTDPAPEPAQEGRARQRPVRRCGVPRRRQGADVRSEPAGQGCIGCPTRDRSQPDRAVSLEPHPVRVYPAEGGAPGTTLASQLLGFVNAEGTGSYGIEQQYNSDPRRHADGLPVAPGLERQRPRDDAERRAQGADGPTST